MSDTQWPRYQVFLQAAPDQPYHNAGSVHAADAEMALMNARDVFVRRPACSGLWVVPAEQIFSWNRQAQAAQAQQSNENPAEQEMYCVFVKSSHKGTHTYSGELRAASAEAALLQAESSFDLQQAIVVWLFAKRSITQSEAEDREAWFDPAHEKPYRDQSYYHIRTMMRNIQQDVISPEESS